MDMRDREMAKKIRALINKHSPVCFVHVGGWEHFVSIKGRNTLFSELRDLNPQIMLLRNF
jgi:hypothetical protein